MSYTYHHLYGFPVTCLRFFTAYGPRQRPEMAIHKFTRQISSGEPVELFGDGSSRRDYTFIGDIVQGVLRAIDTPSGYRVFNLGTTETTTLLDLIQLIADRVEREPVVRMSPDQLGDVPVTFADIRRAEEQLGYAPTTRISSGITEFVKWYKEQSDA
jgi:UDP-glucuronate 4-epimerase